MPVNRRRAVVLLAWLASVVLANFVGGVVGFNQGAMTQLAMSGDEALDTVVILRSLRSGKTTEALGLLEVHLDAQVANCVFGRPSYGSPYNVPMRFAFPDVPVANAWALSQVLQYRREHPPVNPDPSVKARLMERLETYRNAPRPDTSARPTRTR